MLDTAMLADSIYDQENRVWGHDGDNWEGLRGDSASSITPWEEHGRGRSRDYHGLRDVIRARDACGWIKTGTKIGSVKSKNNAIKRTMIIMVLATTNLTGSGHQKRDTSQEALRHIP
jgi:hypothetical protein